MVKDEGGFLRWSKEAREGGTMRLMNIGSVDRG